MADGRSIYTVKLKSHLDPGWLTRLPARSMAVAYEHQLPVTTVTLDVIDQAELVGVLSEMHGLGLRLLSVIHIDDEPAGERKEIPPARTGSNVGKGAQLGAGGR